MTPEDRAASIDTLTAELKSLCNFDEPLRKLATTIVDIIEATRGATAEEIAVWVEAALGKGGLAEDIRAGAWKEKR